MHIAETGKCIGDEVEEHLRIFLVHLMKKLFDQTLYFWVFVLEEQSHVAHVTLHLDHVIQGQMGNDRQSGLTHFCIFFMQVLIQVFIVWLYNVREAV